MRHFLIPAMLVAFAASAAASAPKWLRNTAISPDGSRIAFTYKGDVFTVPVGGGKALQITSGPAYDTAPVWSPDSKTIVFSSDREGSADLYAVDAAGGVPRRLTTDSGTETPLAFSDAVTVVYQSDDLGARESARHPTRLTRTFCVDISKPGARPKLWLSMPVGALSFAPGGKALYQDRKGLENLYRKHERSSGTSDIWLLENGRHTKLTSFNGHDLNPVWMPGSGSYSYISEKDGTLNVWTCSPGSDPRQLTSFEKHPVRSLSAASDGLMAFSWEGEIYTLRRDGKPRKVEVEIVADQYNPDEVKAFVTAGADNMTVSADGKQVAFTLRGDVYVTDTKYKTTRRITDTSAQERCLSFSPDGRKLVYDSDRDGQWQLFISEIKNPAEKSFAYASEVIEKPLYQSPRTAQQPVFSPDGKAVAFLEDRTELKVVDVATGKAVTALDGKFNYSYTDGDVPFEWSPDSRWILIGYIGEGGWNNVDVAAVRADGSETVDLTESGYADGNPKWALGGKAVTYESGRYGMKSHASWGNQSDILLMALDPEAWDEFNATEEERSLREEAEKEAEKEKESSKDNKDKKNKKDKKDKKAGKAKADFAPDFASRRHRMARITDRSSILGDYYLSPKADKLYFTSGATEGGRNLYVRDIHKDETKVLVKGVSGGLMADGKGENLFVLSGEGIKKVSLPGGEVAAVEFEAPYGRSRAAEREYIYEHMLRQVEDKFYDKNLHGVDWKYYGDHYRRFLSEISNNQDFAILLSEILGELNASHTGGSASGGRAKLPVASLGAFFDPEYEGDGLKVSEVIAGGPLDRGTAGVGCGDVVMAIDGKRIKAGLDWYPLLEGKAGRSTRLDVLRVSGKRDTITVRPVDRGTLNELLYARWVERNEHFVDSISGGKIAYVHVKGMDGPSFNAVYDRLLGHYRNAEAVVVDTRWNGGGWLHNDLAVLLNGKRYVDFMPRGRYIGSEPFSQWYKPSVMLVNEGNYSDAHGSPYTYQTLGLGKIVGAPIPGTMTAVWWESQIDPSIVFGIPQVTNANTAGEALENKQLTPDIEVYNDPADELAGHDAQLEAAVKALLK